MARRLLKLSLYSGCPGPRSQSQRSSFWTWRKERALERRRANPKSRRKRPRLQPFALKSDREAALQAAEEDETVSEDKTCPECGEPVHNLRATCPNCGFEYSGDQYDDAEAGKEFIAGSEVDTDG